MPDKTPSFSIDDFIGEIEKAEDSQLNKRLPQERLKNKRGIAHTTVLTTLDRLHRKGYLLREKHAKAFIYSPRYSREEFERKLAQEVLGALIGHFTQPALSTFVELIGEDAGALDQVEALIRAKRREQARSKKED